MYIHVHTCIYTCAHTPSLHVCVYSCLVISSLSTYKCLRLVWTAYYSCVCVCVCVCALVVFRITGGPFEAEAFSSTHSLEDTELKVRDVLLTGRTCMLLWSV